MNRPRLFALGILVIGLALFGAGSLWTSEAHADDLSQPCPDSLSAGECADLKAQYAELQKEIAQEQAVIAQTEAQKQTFAGNVSQLNAQIAKAQAQIKQQNLQITALGHQINAKTTVINQLTSKIDQGHAALAALLRQTDQIDDFSVVEVALGADSVLQFFKDADQIATVQSSIGSQFAVIESAKSQTVAEKNQLTDAQSKTQDAKFVVQTTEQKISADKATQSQLLAITANQEAQYQKVLAQRQAEAAKIRARLFPLRDAAAISFGDAVKYAQAAQKSTGVDPALVLAILTQESNLGANVGQCYLTNDQTGAGVGKNSGNPFSAVMNPTRDVPPFLALAAKLGFDPHKQVVSCPIASAGGYGGAMGPAQFIPSTWALYAPRIGGAANPWDPSDAIAAMALLLKDNGASAGGYTAEFNAAARYYAGWSGPSTAAGKSYANQVMTKVASITQDIDFLSSN